MTGAGTDRIELLLVDGDPAHLERAETALGERDDRLSIRTTSDAESALELLDDAEIDCLVSGYELPETDGIALLERVRETFPDLPFLLWPADGSETLAAESIRAGVTDYVPRATDDGYTTLAERIRDAVETRRASDSRRTYALATEASTDAFFTFDVPSETLHLRSGFEQFGYARDRVEEGIDWWFDRIHPEDRASICETHRALRDGDAAAFDEFDGERGQFSDQFRWRRADGSYIHCLRRGILLFDDGEPTTMVGTLTDITERKERERALAALNAVAVDLDNYETVDGLCERTIEASEDILQFDLSMIDIEEDGYLYKAALSEDMPRIHARTMSVDEGVAGKTYRTGESMLIDDIDSHPEAKPVGPYQSAISIPIGTHGVFQAVSTEPNAFDETDLDLAELLLSHLDSALDRVERERQLRHQNERLEEFTRIVSHDLRNPLNVASGNLRLAQEECDSTYLEEAMETVARMESILEDTLTLAREGRLVDEMQTVSLEELARSCWRNVATESATLEVADDELIRADPDRLRHVFENLYRNAVEHGSTSPDSQARQDAVEHSSTSSQPRADDAVEHGSTSPDSQARQDATEGGGPETTVRIGALADGFYVEDDGPGIPEDEREKVFDLGYTSEESSGFGLAIVRQIAEAHGWTVRVTDGTDGGARFEFTGVDKLNRK